MLSLLNGDEDIKIVYKIISNRLQESLVEILNTNQGGLLGTPDAALMLANIRKVMHQVSTLPAHYALALIYSKHLIL